MNSVRKFAIAFSFVAGVVVPVYPQGVAISIRNSNAATDPANCQPASTNIYINRNSTPVLKICTASNTWLPLVTSGSSGGWPLLAPNGTSSAPSFSFTNFPTLGLYANTNLALAQGTGTLLVTGTTAVPSALTTALVVAAGNINACAHSYQTTFVTAGGETSAGTTSNSVTNDGTHAQNTLTAVPTGNQYVTQRKIYRNTCAAPTVYQLQQTIADNTSTSGVQDNTADAGLGAAIPSTNTAIDTRVSFANAGDPTLAAGSCLKWGSSGVSTPDTIICRDAANTLAQRNGANAQIFNIYNTYTDAANNEFLTARFISNVAYIYADKNGSGTGRSMVLGPAGTTTSLSLQDSGSVRATLSGGIFLPTASIFRVTGDFTSASSTALQTITGLSWVLPANTAANYPFHCEILYNQTVAAVADQFGIQAASLAPTNIMAKADVNISASTFTSANLPTLTTTTATAIVTFTPTAITTIWNAKISGMIENPSGVANTINIMVQQSTAADLMVVKKDSYCVVGN